MSAVSSLPTAVLRGPTSVPELHHCKYKCNYKHMYISYQYLYIYQYKYNANIDENGSIDR